MLQSIRPPLQIPQVICKSIIGLCFTALTVFCAAPSLLAQDAVYSRQATGVPGPKPFSSPVSLNITQTSATTKKSETTATATQSSTVVEPTIVVSGDELPSAYGAPGSFSRSRFSTLTNAYVLPPGGVFAGLIYEGDFDTHGPTDHFLTQEVEVGLPYRFGVAIENEIEFAQSDVSNRAFSIEARWALADWDKIPLNPTLFAEYKFGTGRILHEEGPEEEMMMEDEEGMDDEEPPPDDEEMMREEGGRPDQPDAYEFRLLLSEEIAKNIQWSFNAFLENETSGDRGREWGFAQSVQVPILLPHERLKAGIEMQYKNFTVKDTRGDPVHSFVIGPSLAYKPTARMRFDIAPLFGATEDSPDVQVFAIFSYVFGGGGGETGAEAPASTRNR
jgi:hypothetical protein